MVLYFTYFFDISSRKLHSIHNAFHHVKYRPMPVKLEELSRSSIDLFKLVFVIKDIHGLYR